MGGPAARGIAEYHSILTPRPTGGPRGGTAMAQPGCSDCSPLHLSRIIPSRAAHWLPRHGLLAPCQPFAITPALPFSLQQPSFPTLSLIRRHEFFIRQREAKTGMKAATACIRLERGGALAAIRRAGSQLLFGNLFKESFYHWPGRPNEMYRITSLLGRHKPASPSGPFLDRTQILSGAGRRKETRHSRL